MSLPTKHILEAGLVQLNNKWTGKNGITKVLLQTDPSGKIPGYYFQGTTVTMPADLPGRMVVPDADGRPYSVAVFWRRDVKIPQVSGVQSPNPEIFNPSGNARLPLDPLADEDIDKAMWFFATPANLNRSVENILPSFHAIPQPTNMAPPSAEEINTQLHIDMRLPQYDNPNFWSKPFQPNACMCCAYYARPITVYSYVVPDTYLLRLTGISYDISSLLPFGTVFQVDILRGGSIAASFEEIVVDPANADPSKRVAFASHETPSPLFVLVDRGETLSIQLTVKGPYPFTKNEQDTFCGTICLLLQGWIATIMDNRDGAPRPSDVGEMRAGVGNETYADLTEDYVKTLLTWVSAVTGSK